MDQENEEYLKIQAGIRKDIAEVLGSDIERTLQSLQNHMLDAISAILTIHMRFHCINCMQERMYTEFFEWFNSEGAEIILKTDYNHRELCSHATRWALNWVTEQMLSPCTDSMPSGEVH